MIRTLAAVAAGYVAMAVVVMIGTAAAVAALVPGGVASMRNRTPGPLPAGYLVANLAVSFAAAVLGGWVAVWLATTPTLTPALFLCALVVIVAFAMYRKGPQPGQPTWYPLIVNILCVIGVLVGGWVKAAGLRF